MPTATWTAGENRWKAVALRAARVPWRPREDHVGAVERRGTCGDGPRAALTRYAASAAFFAAAFFLEPGFGGGAAGACSAFQAS